MTTVQWLLGFHLVGAFLFVSGAVAVGNPATRALNYGSFAAAVAILALMIWKPGP